jgi:polyisoprenoid-binding protein YceI
MQNKNVVFIGAAALFLIIAVSAAVWAYDFVLGEPEAASGPITALPLAINTNSPATNSPVVQPTQPPPTAAQATALPAPSSPAPTATTEPTAVSAAGETHVSQQSGLNIFEISQEQSKASFSIYEELAGEPKTVVGTTNQVAGQIAVDLNDLSKTQVGVIQVNARTLLTDNDRRNNAIRNRILQTDQYEYITFTPKDVIGLSGSAQPGQTVTFQIAGDLTIRNITRPAVFEVTVQGESTSRITGSATAVITRADFNLVIPTVPNVANVGEEVTLEINFVAEAA